MLITFLSRLIFHWKFPSNFIHCHHLRHQTSNDFNQNHHTKSFSQNCNKMTLFFFFYSHSFLGSIFCCNDLSQKPNILQHPTAKSVTTPIFVFRNNCFLDPFCNNNDQKKCFDCKVITYVMVALKMTWKIAFVRVLHKDIAFSIYFE